MHLRPLLRETAFGQLVRLTPSGKKIFPYPEELPDFVCPKEYRDAGDSEKTAEAEGITPDHESDGTPTPPEFEKIRTPQPDFERIKTHRDSTSGDVERALSLVKSRTNTMPFTEERLEVDRELAVEKTKSRPIIPQRTADGTILVDWYTTDDIENPQNWSTRQKFFVALLIDIYTFAVYTGSAIYVSSELGIMVKFDVGFTKASLGLSLYVLAYGIGPLLWAPLSEIPAIGRNPIYVGTFAIFTILCVPTALVNNYAGLMVLRFLQGFFGSPCLANGGASMGDLYSFVYLPYALTFWVSAAYCGPALGPLLSGFAVSAKGWRWSLWEILWIASPAFLAFFFFLPETSGPNILARRAQRLRQKTGDPRLQSQSEIDQRNLRVGAILVDAIIKPLEISAKDPAVAFTNVYTAIVYGIYYSFFEAFPLVYPPMYGFNLGEVGVAFICIVIACALGVAVYCAYVYWVVTPDMMKNGLGPQEGRLKPALIAVFFPTLGLFLFGWTARPSIHWIASIIGITLYGAGVFVLLQCIFLYIPLSYPKYAASLFAANDFVRSAFACGSILFARPMYVNLGIGKGISLLGGLSVLGIIGIYILYFYGAKLRARSKFAQS